MSSQEHSTFAKLFPPPTYLSMPAVGINISDHSIKMLELRERGDSFELGDYETKPLPPGAVVGGKIQKPEEVVAALRALKEDYGLTFIRASIPEEEGYIFSTMLPGVQEKDIYSALEFRISEHVPLSVSDAIFDYTLIKGRDDSALEVNVAVLPRGVVETHMGLFRDAGLVPLSLEIEAQTIARSVIDAKSREAILLVDIGRTRTGIAVADCQIVRHTSTLSMGGDAFVELIQKDRNCTPEEAEALKQSAGIVPREYREETAIALREVLSGIGSEISRRMEFWNSQVSKRIVLSEPVTGVVLCGGNATMPGLREALAAELGIKVEIANVWRNAFSFDDIIPPIEFNHSLGYASAIGLALMK